MRIDGPVCGETGAALQVTMAGWLAPYVRYYASKEPTDDHGAMPSVLLDFGEELAARQVRSVAPEEVGRSGI